MYLRAKAKLTNCSLQIYNLSICGLLLLKRSSVYVRMKIKWLSRFCDNVSQVMGINSFRGIFMYHKDYFCILAKVEKKKAKIISTKPPVLEINPANFIICKLNIMVYNEILYPWYTRTFPQYEREWPSGLRRFNKIQNIPGSSSTMHSAGLRDSTSLRRLPVTFEWKLFKHND